MSDTNALKMRYAKETVPGTPPGGTYIEIEPTGESIESNQESSFSNRIRSDRQNSGVVRTNRGVQGDVNVEMSYGSNDDWLEWGLMSAVWTGEAIRTAATISFNATANINDTGAGFGIFSAGDIVRVTGSTGGTNDGFYLVTAATANDLTVAHQAVTTQAAGPAVTVTRPAYIQNGSTLTSFTLEKEYTDLVNAFSQFKRCSIAGFEISVPATERVTGVFNILGKEETSPSPVATDAAANTAPATSEVFASVTDIDALIEDVAAYSGTQFTMKVTNNLRTRTEIGSLGFTSLGTGSFEVTGQLNAYANSLATVNKFLAFTSSSLTVRFKDAANQYYVVHLPRVKFTTKSRAAGGKDQDIMLDMGYMAYRHETYGFTTRIYRDT